MARAEAQELDSRRRARRDRGVASVAPGRPEAELAMSHPTTESYLLASRELLLSVGQNTPGLSAEEQANIQEAVEHIDRAWRLRESHHE